MQVTATPYQGGHRSIRSIDSIGSIIFSKRRGGRDLSGVQVSALHDAWRPKKRQKTETEKFGFFVKFDSIDSIIGVIRSIMR